MPDVSSASRSPSTLACGLHAPRIQGLCNLAQRPRPYTLKRANSRTTVVGCHSPPRGASMARRLSSSAIFRMLVMPWA